MQLARQSAFKTDKPARSKKDARAATIAAIHITWTKIRRDLKGDKDELRESRLAFMSQVLKREVKSSRDLTQSKLGKVLDAMRDLETAPMLPGAAVLQRAEGKAQSPALGSSPFAPGEIVHLATEAQVATITKLFNYLGWRLEAIEGFLLKRFKVKSHRVLTPAKANSLTMILLNIAAANAIRHRGHTGRVSRKMIHQEIPALKQRLAIDQKPIEETLAADNDYDEEGFV